VMKKQKPEMRVGVYPRAQVYHRLRQWHDGWYPICGHWGRLGGDKGIQVLDRAPRGGKLCKGCERVMQIHEWGK
jgi:hypothetical protein